MDVEFVVNLQGDIVLPVDGTMQTVEMLVLV